MEILYKYKSLKDLKPILDMIVLDKIYGAKLNELNDPMEGALFSLMDTDVDEKIKQLKKNKWDTRICSFSKTYKNALMWAHYADGFRGCCIGVEVKTNSWKKTDVIYDANVKLDLDTISAENLFTNKHPLWEYEKEVRYIKAPGKNNQRSINSTFKVKVREIYFGTRVDRSIEKMITTIAEAVNPKLKGNIKRITKEDLEYNYIIKL